MVRPSHSSAVSTGQLDPPGMSAFNFLPLRMPPPTSSIICFTGKPMRSSYTPGLLTWPVRQVILVPPALGTPSAGVRVEIEIEPRAVYVFSQPAMRVRLGDGLVHDLDQVAIFAAHVNVPG